jgi:hypothetical protein
MFRVAAKSAQSHVSHAPSLCLPGCGSPVTLEYLPHKLSLKHLPDHFIGHPAVQSELK